MTVKGAAARALQCISTQDKHAGEEGDVAEGSSGRGTEAAGVS